MKKRRPFWISYRCTTFLDCHIRAFDYLGGVPEQILYDRMKNVFIKELSGEKKMSPSKAQRREEKRQTRKE